MRTLIVLPSYNEANDILSMIQALLKLHRDFVVCVVDDSSPDGTSKIVSDALRTKRGWSKRVHLITREKKDGRGGAVRTGFDWGLQEKSRKFQTFIEMDCDFSHRPEDISTGLRLLSESHQIVIGARYPDGTIIGWPRGRRIFSWFANRLARFLISPEIPDYTNGFRFYNRAAVETLLNYTQKHKGYIYLSESLTQLLENDFRVASFPIVFKNRERGVSNTNLAEIKNAFLGIFSIAWNHRREMRRIRANTGARA